MRIYIYTLLQVMLLAAIINPANAQSWRPKHAGLPYPFSAKSVYGEAGFMIVANTSGTVGSQMYYTPDTSTAFTGSASSLGLFAPVVSGVAKCMGVHFAGSTTGIYKSHDNGQTWVTTGTAGSIYAVYSCNDTLYTSMGFLVKMSVDTGNTWTDLHYAGAGLAVSFYRASGVLYVGTTTGLQYTSDLGATWTSVTAPAGMVGVTVPGITGLNSSVYAACANGVFKTSDNGRTWANVLAQDMFCLITVDTSLIGGTANHGIYRSDATGVAWSTVNTGMPPSGGLYQAVNYLSFNDYFVIASTQSDSVIYVTGLAELGLHATTSTLGVRYGMQSNEGFTVYPNPAKDELLVGVESGTTAGVKITIIDMTGRCVKSLNGGAGTRIRVDTRELPAGNYMLHASKDQQSVIKKITIVR